MDPKPVIAALVEKFGKANEARITRGVTQVASLWRASVDGDLKAFCLEQFISDPKVLGQCELGETIHATPAIGGGALFVRTEKALYCFARGEKD